MSRLIWVREGWVEMAADPPPQCRCGVIIRQRLAVGCASAAAVWRRPRQREMAANRPARMGAKLSSLTLGASCATSGRHSRHAGAKPSGHRLVEAALPDPGRLVSLNGTGGAPVVWTDAHGGPPYLDVLRPPGMVAGLQPGPAHAGRW